MPEHLYYFLHQKRLFLNTFLHKKYFLNNYLYIPTQFKWSWFNPIYSNMIIIDLTIPYGQYIEI